MSKTDHIAVCGCTTDWVDVRCGKCLGCCTCEPHVTAEKTAHITSVAGALAVARMRRQRAPDAAPQ